MSVAGSQRPDTQRTTRAWARRSARLITFVAGLSLAACNEASAPIETPSGLAKRESLQYGPDAPALLTHDTSYTVVQGEAATLVVYYDQPQTPGLDKGEWFFQLELPSTAQFVTAQGIPVLDGDSVDITVRPTSGLFAVGLGPDGSQFPGSPAIMTFNYKHANLGGRSASDLIVWYQPAGGGPWLAQRTAVDQLGRRIIAHIDHFSNYAIAW